MAPFVVKDRVIVGPSGGEFGIHGWVKALDLATGKIVWTAYNVGPDADMLVDPASLQAVLRQGSGPRPHAAGPRTPGSTAARRCGAGSPTIPSSIWSTTASAIPARTTPSSGRATTSGPPASWRADPATAHCVWAYQFTPHDNWDYDSNAEMILVDLTIGGHGRARCWCTSTRTASPTRSIAPPARCWSAKPFVHVNWATGVDLTTGRPVLDSTKLTGASQGQREGHLSRASRAARVPRRRRRTRRAPGCSTSRPTTSAWTSTRSRRRHDIRGTPYIGANTPYSAARRQHGRVHRLGRRCTGKKVWEIQEQFPVWSGALATGGRRGVLRHARRLVQGGRREDRHGALEVQGGIGRGRRADHLYRGPDGKQYVAVYAGIGGDWALLSGDVRVRRSRRRARPGRLHPRPGAIHQSRGHGMGVRIAMTPSDHREES